MPEAPNTDPFAGIEDERPATPAETRSELLQAARRGYVPIRKEFVQRKRGSGSRAAKLAELVHGRHQRPLDALLLLHALQPVLTDEPLSVSTWARLLSVGTHCTANAATKTFSTLVDLDLVERTREGRRPIVRPLHELTGDEWTRPGTNEEAGPGYFTLPHAYWTSGYADSLKLPGKAMLLIMLAETQSMEKQHFTMAQERASEWYGLSERTAERGYRELSLAGLTMVRVQKVADSRHPAGRREVWHRALKSPFTTAERGQLQADARPAAKQAAGGGRLRSISLLLAPPETSSPEWRGAEQPRHGKEEANQDDKLRNSAEL